MKPGDWAWVALATAILAYELRAPKGELLSQACDRYRTRRPIATHAIIIYLAGHLTRTWPRTIDPLCRLTAWAGR
jgi:hypothetical protein